MKAESVCDIREAEKEPGGTDREREEKGLESIR